jgi:hypothetical protein
VTTSRSPKRRHLLTLGAILVASTAAFRHGTCFYSTLADPTWSRRGIRRSSRPHSGQASRLSPMPVAAVARR